MHVPNPLGGYPLVLRTSDTASPRKGELLLDYTSYKIYFTDHTGTKIDVAKSIYDKIIAAKLQNSRISAVKASSEVTGDEDVIPDAESRKFNTWYMNIYKRDTRSEENEE